MGKWLSYFHAEAAVDPHLSPRANSAFSADSPAQQNEAGPIGTKGANGTGGGRRKGADPADLSALKALLARGQESEKGHVRDHQDALDDYEERAAVIEFDGHLPRAEAERRARTEVFGDDVILDADGIPCEPCPKCRGRHFWRASLSPGSPWCCRRCVPPLPTVTVDGCSLPKGGGR